MNTMNCFNLRINVACLLVLVVDLTLTITARSEVPVTNVEAPCLTVEISGATDNTNCNGRYRLDESFSTHCSGRQSWSRYDSLTIGDNWNATAFLYYLEDSYDGWVIAQTSCSSWGNFKAMVKTDSQEPFDLSERWMEYSETSKKFLSNDIMKVTCTERGTNYCSSSPCFNGAECDNNVRGFTCQCDELHTGTFCETLRDDAPRLRFSTKFVIAIVVLLGVFVVVVMFTCIVCRRKRQLRHRRTDALKEFRRNIYVGGADNQNKYKLLEEQMAAPDTN